jgi:hypothetical protein
MSSAGSRWNDRLVLPRPVDADDKSHILFFLLLSLDKSS